MPYKRTPSVCDACHQPYMARPKQVGCSRTCTGAIIRARTDSVVIERFDRSGPPIERFPELGSCWVYTGDTNAAGYGFLHRRDEESLMHRRAWIAATGEALTSDDVIGHVCDNPPCARNDSVGTYEVDGRLLPRRGHLFRGTQTDNAADKVAKGRQQRGDTHYHRLRPDTIRRGESVGNTRLTEALVRYLRKRYASGGVTYHDLSEETGISAMAICRAVRGDSWKHVR